MGPLIGGITMSQVTETEIIEYLWPRMGDYRRSVLVKHFIHGDQRSAKRFLAHVKHGQKKSFARVAS
jgi:hypothetical protein